MGRLSRRLKNKGLLKKAGEAADPSPQTESSAPAEAPAPKAKGGGARRRALGRMKARSAARNVPRKGAKGAAKPRARRLPERLPDGNLGIPQWTDLINEYPDYTNAYLERGILLFKSGRKENALFDFNKVLGLEPGNHRALIFRGRINAAMKKWEEALEDLETGIKLGKRADADVFHLAATCCLKINDLDGALRHLDRGLKGPVPHLPSALMRADLLIRRREYDDALEDIETVLAKERRNAAALAGRAQINIIQGNFGKAKDDLDAALKADPKLPSPWHDRGIIRMKKKEFSGAIEDLEKSLRLDPTQIVDPRYADAYLNRADENIEAEKWDGAISDYNQVQRLNPDLLPVARLAGAHRQRARVRGKDGAWAKAVSDWETAQQFSPAGDKEKEEHLDALYELGKVRAGAGQHDEALDLLGRVLQVHPDTGIDAVFGPSFGHRGIDCFEAEDFESALRELDRAVTFCPDNPEFLEYIARARLALGQGADAAEDFESLLMHSPDAELEPECFTSFADRARERLKENDIDGAISDFETAAEFLPDIRTDDDYLKAYVMRCDAMLKVDDVEEGLAALEHALSLKPDMRLNPHVAAAYCKRARIRMEAGEDDRGLADCATATKIDPKNAEAHVLAGNIHQERMDYADAIAHYKKALKLDPSRKETLQSVILQLENEMA